MSKQKIGDSLRICIQLILLFCQNCGQNFGDHFKTSSQIILMIHQKS